MGEIGGEEKEGKLRAEKVRGAELLVLTGYRDLNSYQLLELPV